MASMDLLEKVALEVEEAKVEEANCSGLSPEVRLKMTYFVPVTDVRQKEDD